MNHILVEFVEREEMRWDLKIWCEINGTLNPIYTHGKPWETLKSRVVWRLSKSFSFDPIQPNLICKNMKISVQWYLMNL